MSRISALIVLIGVCGTVLCGGDHEHGGKKGHGHGGMMGMMRMSKEAEAVMCKAENVNDDKFDQYRAEVEACMVDECGALADDVTGVEKTENKLLARIHCSEKYKTCMKEKFQKMKGGEGEEPSEEQRTQWREKIEEKKGCIKAAFEKVFGPTA